MVRASIIALCAGLLFLVAACGGGGSGSSGSGSALSQTDVRKVLSAILVASAKDDYAAVSGHLAAREFMGANMTSTAKNFDKLTPAEREEYGKSCFNQAKAVTSGTTLRDMASIDAALASGTVLIHEKVRKAEVTFQGQPADGKGGIQKFKANLVLYPDNNWHLMTLEGDFGR
ncbi:MAG: hypothetical protein K8T90_13870 [Planctomycetes bacterium]|nr:hypothetical protein [Planctomycetota bacterium]